MCLPFAFSIDIGCFQSSVTEEEADDEELPAVDMDEYMASGVFEIEDPNRFLRKI